MASRPLSLSAFVVALAALLWLSPGAPRTPAAQNDPAALVRAYWTEPDDAARAALARRIASHPDYRPSRLRDWLHGGVPFEEMAPGTATMTVESEPGTSRQVTLILPDGYRRDRAWPLVYALHPSGEPADTWAEQVRRMLGSAGARVRHRLARVPAELHRRQAAIRGRARRRHRRRRASRARRCEPRVCVRVFEGRVRGLVRRLYFADRFAGVIALAAGFDVAPGPDGFWAHLAGNIAHVPVLNAWGEKDPLVIRDLADKPAGTFAESNRWFARELNGLGLPITNIEVVGGLHNQLAPPGEAIVEILNRRRVVDPQRVGHVFRHLHQASSYWIEGLTWAGDAWGEPWPTPAAAQPGESEAAALAQTLEPLLGRLTGARDGQTIRVTRRHIGDIVIWFGERSVKWDEPVSIERDGKLVYLGEARAGCRSRAREGESDDGLRAARLCRDSRARVR